MQYWIDIRALKAIGTSLIILVVSLGFVLPVQAVTYNKSGIQSMELTDLVCTKDNIKSHHQADIDCCDQQPCSQDMDCGIDCVAQQVGSTALLKTYSSELNQDKSDVRTGFSLASYAYLVAFDAPPPRK